MIGKAGPTDGEEGGRLIIESQSPGREVERKATSTDGRGSGTEELKSMYC